MLYDLTLKSLTKFDKKVSFNKINVLFLNRYKNWMLEQDKSITTVGMYLRNLRAIFNLALNEKTIKEYPFREKPSQKDKFKIPTGKNIKKALTIEEIQKIFDYKPENKNEYLAKSYWVFSYLCNGINMKDIANLKFKKIHGNRLTFIREKTKDTAKEPQEIQAILLPKAMSIIDSIGNKDKDPDNYIFPIWSKVLSAEQNHHRLKRYIKTINKYMNEIASKLEINKKINTYTARHSYSTVLKRSGVSVEFISEQLGHHSTEVTQNYLDSFEDEALEKNAMNLINFKTGSND
jgi:integrase/recombinase XerD